jgi:methylthioribose-1-phosphate isomerase
MWVRRAPLIGVTVSYGMAFSMHVDPLDVGLKNAYDELYVTRPTAVNLRWALDDIMALLETLDVNQRRDAAYIRALEIADADVDICSSIGDFGKKLIKEAWV